MDGTPPPSSPSRWRRVGARIVDQLVRIRTRLLLINLIAVLVPVVGIGWARTFEREGLKALERDMRHIAETVRTVLEKNLDRRRRPQLAVVAPALVPIARRTRMRVRVLDRRGALLADSHRLGPPEGPEPARPVLLGRAEPPRRRHPPDDPATDPGPIADRPEIRAARRGQLGTATRIHQRINRVFLFLAMPVMVARRVEGVVYVTRSTYPVLESMYHLRRNLLQVLVVALGVTVLLTLFLAATISRPLGKLTRAAQRLAQGDRSASLALHRRDETGQLAAAFETLLQRLDARARYISEFAANISHEFKTPLASIRGAAELLQDATERLEPMEPDARARFLANILADVQRLDRLVSRLLELSRIEATLEHREPLDLIELVREAMESFPGRPIDLEAPQRLPCTGHRAHLVSMLRALLENAVQHGPDDAPVTVTVAREGRRARLRVHDEGPGISPANQRRIFDRFFTTDAARGTGLGLAIVATVVRAHGGAVAVESAPGAGATFDVTLPIAG